MSTINQVQSIHIGVIVGSKASDAYLTALDFTVEATSAAVDEHLIEHGFDFIEFGRGTEERPSFIIILDNFDDAFVIWKLFALSLAYPMSDVQIYAQPLTDNPRL